jgi:hypothetical protein
MISTEKQRSRREAWLLMRARGKRRYVFVYGTSWVALFVQGKNLGRVLISRMAVEWGYLPFDLVITVALGWGLFYWIWRTNEKKYGPSLADRQPG